MATAAGRAGGIGWEYVHVAGDAHSRLAYVEVLPEQRGTPCATGTVETAIVPDDLDRSVCQCRWRRAARHNSGR